MDADCPNATPEAKKKHLADMAERKAARAERDRTARNNDAPKGGAKVASGRSIDDGTDNLLIDDPFEANFYTPHHTGDRSLECVILEVLGG